MDYEKLKIVCGVLGTIGLYSVLYRENKFYRFFEHMFLGLAAGWMMVALWTETLKENWYDLLVGRIADEGGKIEANGYYIWAILLPIGLMGYFVFSKKNAWISRIPIGIIIGLWSGQQLQTWLTKYGPQMRASMNPILPNTWERMTVPYYENASPEQLSDLAVTIYPSQALVNFISLFTVLCVLSYFLFSMDVKSKTISWMPKMGRYLLMIGFGAIFGSTVMMRFSLLIDRMFYLFVESVKVITGAPI
jgi:hypothetical protein